MAGVESVPVLAVVDGGASLFLEHALRAMTPHSATVARNVFFINSRYPSVLQRRPKKKTRTLTMRPAPAAVTTIWERSIN
jgi:hypothetical protein